MIKKKKTQINNEQIKKFEEKIVELENGWKRTQADFANYQKRTEIDKTNLIKSANKDLILKLLPILDNFNRALDHKPVFLDRHSEFTVSRSELCSTTGVSESQEIPNQVRDDINNIKEISDYLKGLEQIKNQLDKILVNHGLEKINVKAGDEFDPQIHEAIMTEESDKFDTDQIIKVIEGGYKLGNELIRPVKVKVGK